MMKNEKEHSINVEMDASHPSTYMTPIFRPKPNSQTEDQKSSESEHALPDKWCIYRVPSKLRKVNEAAYTPQLVSIGPFHHGKPELKDMEKHKENYYENFCARFSKSKAKLKPFIEDRQKQTLCCYAGTTDQLVAGIDLVDMIGRDACFIIELFLVNSELENHKDDYILKSPWLKKAIEQDLMLFENQLPYSLLQELYDYATSPPSSIHPSEGQAQEPSNPNNKSCCLACFQDCFSSSCREAHHSGKVDNAHPFLKLTCEFFKDYRMGESVKNPKKAPKHFTDLVRHFLCPEKKLSFEAHSLSPPKGPTKNIYSVKQLRAAGVKFRPLKKKDGYLIEVGAKILTLACFRNMDLKLTQFQVKDETECIMRNVIALEQFLYPNEAYICNYFLLMDELVNTREDVNLLVENKVIINMLGSEKAVAKLINSLCEHIMEDESCYVDVGKQLNEHYENFWNRHVATLRQVYFKDLWTASATIVGICVVVLSITISLRTIIFGHKLYFHK